jgi:Trk K+ transport system NAD-binding subunit/mannitol/fructose-specific phosphotransferase system IIA component (Ntr-type)
MLAGSVVADVLALLAFTVALGIVEIGTVATSEMLLVAAKIAAFFLVTILLGIKLFPYASRFLTRAGLTGRTFNFMLVLILAVAFGELAKGAGLHAILGAFFAGLFLRENVLGIALSREIKNAARDTSVGLLAPVFFITAGFQVSFGIFQEQLDLFLIVFAVAIVGKTLGTALFYLPSGHGWRESLVIGAGMNGRGAVDIILIAIALEMGIIEQDIFSILVFMALLTTATVPVTLKTGISWLHRRGELIRSILERVGTIIVGAGPLARTLARLLVRSRTVVLVDNNVNHCVVSKSEGLTAIYGSALKERVLSEAQAGHADTLIAMTPNVEVNTLVTQSARDVFSIPNVYLLQAGAEQDEQIQTRRHLQADALFARSVDLEDWDHRISHGNFTQVSKSIERNEDAASYTARLHDEKSCIVLALSRGEEYLPLHEQTELIKGDEVYVLYAADKPSIKQDRFDRVAATCPILDLRKINSADDFFDLVGNILSERLNVDNESLARTFLQGETWSSTVVSPGLAIPHILLIGQHPFQLLIARSIDGIHFPNQDPRVHIIFVMASSREDRNFHLRALSAIAQIVQDASFEEQWMAADNTEALRELILKADRRRFPDNEITPSET